MNSEVLFYWLSWIIWVIVTFLMVKGRQRTLFACWILLSIICANIHLTIGNISISLSFLIVMAGSMVLLIQDPKLKYHLFSSFTIMIGYGAILLLEKNSPVLMIFPRPLMLSLITVLLVVILTKGFHARLAIGLFGMSAGEMIYSLTLASYGFYEPVGQIHFLGNAITTVIMIMILEVVIRIKIKLFPVKQKYNPSVRVAK